MSKFKAYPLFEEGLEVSSRDFVDPIDQEFICVLCDEIPFPPARCGDCGGKICIKCTSYMGNCPSCSGRNFVNDHEAEFNFKHSYVRCSKCEGTWVGQVYNFENHIACECGAKDFPCPLFKLRCCTSECTGLIYEFDRKNHLMQAGLLQSLKDKIGDWKDRGITASSPQGWKLVAMEHLSDEMESMMNHHGFPDEDIAQLNAEYYDNEMYPSSGGERW